MSWKEIENRLRHGAKLVLTDDIPGGWCIAIRVPCASGRHVLIRVGRLPAWVGDPRPDDRRPLMAAVEMLIASPESLN